MSDCDGYSSSNGDEGLECDVDRMETEEDSDAAEDSELTLEIFIILAVDEELVVVNIGAGGKGNIVFEEDLEANCAGGGEDIDKDPDDAEEFSDKVTLFT